MKTRAVFVFGASGVGKTAVARHLDQRAPWTGRVHYFDDIGVPPMERMIEEHGSGEGWQQWAAEQWVSRLAVSAGPLRLLEGQARPSFINRALRTTPSLDPILILLDCSPDVRRHRLGELRRHPELANPRMETWAAYLRGQADALGLTVIDTSDLDVAAVANQVEAIGLDGLLLGAP